MVKILTTYSPTNRAAVEFTIRRFPSLDQSPSGKWVPPKEDGLIWHDTRVALSPLSQAITTGNKDIIEAVLRAYTTPKNLYGAYTQIQATQQESLMRIWLEQSGYLLKGKYTPVTMVGLSQNKRQLSFLQQKILL